MATVFTTLSVSLTATYELEVPDEWTLAEVEDHLSEIEVFVSVDPYEPSIPSEVTLVGLSLEGVETTSTDSSFYTEEEN
jgi:hypothetical protein